LIHFQGQRQGRLEGLEGLEGLEVGSFQQSNKYGIRKSPIKMEIPMVKSSIRDGFSINI